MTAKKKWESFALSKNLARLNLSAALKEGQPPNRLPVIQRPGAYPGKVGGTIMSNHATQLAGSTRGIFGAWLALKKECLNSAHQPSAAHRVPTPQSSGKSSPGK
ncbi:hypothetical protein [Marinobacter sp.]|uniref:hypothetical protein n=1 Tax=Marinobacter sp. TaxID=50741 RepID=UPI0034A4470A